MQNDYELTRRHPLNHMRSEGRREAVIELWRKGCIWPLGDNVLIL